MKIHSDLMESMEYLVSFSTINSDFQCNLGESDRIQEKFPEFYRKFGWNSPEFG
jgi:hypothetical protein